MIFKSQITCDIVVMIITSDLIPAIYIIISSVLISAFLIMTTSTIVKYLKEIKGEFLKTDILVNNVNQQIIRISNEIDKIKEKIKGFEENITRRTRGKTGPEENITYTSTMLNYNYHIDRVNNKEYKILKSRKLSPTEIQILRMLLDGPLNIRDIRSKIKLSREHLARELKKLYEMGYVERRTDTKPYTYYIKDEKLDEIRRIIS